MPKYYTVIAEEEHLMWSEPQKENPLDTITTLRARLQEAENVIDYYSDTHGERWLRMYLDGKWRNVFDVEGLAHAKARSYRAKHPKEG